MVQKQTDDHGGPNIGITGTIGRAVKENKKTTFFIFLAVAALLLYLGTQ